MSQVKIAVNEKFISVKSPYNPDFPAEARKLGGKWNPRDKTWEFDPRDEGRIRELCIAVYGTDGSPIDGSDLVAVRIIVQGISEQSYWRFGRRILNRPGRDSPVRLGEGVVILDGEFPASGGSRKNPIISKSRYQGGGYYEENGRRKYNLGEDVTPPVTLEVRDLPRAAVLADDGEYEIVDEKDLETIKLVKAKKLLEQAVALVGRNKVAELLPS